MKNKFDLVCQYIDDHKEDIIADWKTVVNIESHTPDAAGVLAVAETFKSLFEGAGLTCELVETGGNPTLVGIIGADRPGKPILFGGHMDTVFPKGTFGENPFRIEDGKAYGPGALDMKGGIIISLYVIKALNSIGYDEAPLKIVYSGDEEIAHEGSNGGQVFHEAVAGGAFAFNMETGNPRNALVLARKGCLRCEVVVTGVEAHAGNDYFAGKNAILEMAHKSEAFVALNNEALSTTVNLGTITGGTMPNCVAGSCTMILDCRFWTIAEKERLEKGIAEIAEKSFIGGTTATYRFYSIFPPFEDNPYTRKFFDHCVQTAEKFGLPVPTSCMLGGSSDASHMSMQNVPAICSFGVQGEWNHTVREYALVDSMYYRSKFIAAIILNKDAFLG